MAEAKARDKHRDPGLGTLYKHWKCTDKTCDNGEYYCFVDRTGANKHYPIDKHTAMRWDNEIRSGKSSLEEPSDSLKASLVNARPNPRAAKKKATETPVMQVHNHINLSSHK